MSTYRAFEVTGTREFALVERELGDPLPGQVRLRVHSCGVCHSHFLAVEGLRADPSQPIVPGHEIVGVIDAVGAGVTAWHAGDRVGVGYLGGQDNECEFCCRGISSTAPTSHRPAPRSMAVTPNTPSLGPAGWSVFRTDWVRLRRLRCCAWA